MLTKKMRKITVSMAMIIVLSMILSTAAMAYRCDGVTLYEIFPGGVDCMGELFIESLDPTGEEYYMATARTRVSERTANITEIYVSYWFEEYNGATEDTQFFMRSRESYAPEGEASTPSMDDFIGAFNPVYLGGYHRVKYKVAENSYLTWEGYTEEIDDVINNR